MTSFVFNEVPVTGGTIRAVGSIDQDAHTVDVTVPPGADVSALAPFITYIGRSIAEPGGSDQTANPFAGGAKDFSGPQTYTVRDQSNSAQDYAVRVIKQSPVAVNFTGETEGQVIQSSVYDQQTGVITLTVDSAHVGGPYEWYVDGVKQGVSNTETTLTLNVGSGTFLPGRHEITVSGKKGGLHYTGKVYFDVFR
jgi:hypothetical protein